MAGGTLYAAPRLCLNRNRLAVVRNTQRIKVKILMVLTSHEDLGDTGLKTGVWLEEFAAPFFIFTDAGADVTLASPKGGRPPIDPNSLLPDAETDATLRFQRDENAQRALAETTKLSAIDAGDYDALFYPGGHGPMFDLVDNRDSIKLIESVYAAGKPVAAVCHGPAVFRYAQTSDGFPLVQGKSITEFTNSEEAAAGLTHAVPFLVEDMLKKNGGTFSKALDWQSHILSDHNLITGQNPASSDAAARALLEKLYSNLSSKKTQRDKIRRQLN
jgi:putative intracellular protease/amidase